ncbi:MAG: E3 ubiquitin protein ligase [Candidatus Heimdallarchaeota archaeon]|nr:E3 ubiquitin protein ligase [Candidatus Heimdallarchaeota archaeon]
MSQFIPIKEEGIDPINHVKPYMGDLSDKDIATLIGIILFVKDVKIKLLEQVLELPRLDVEEKLGRIMQSDFCEGEFTRTSFILKKLNYSILQQTPRMDLEELTLLAYIKARYIVSLSELEQAFSLNYEAIVQYIARFIAWGVISVEFNDNETFNVIVYYKLEKKSEDEIGDIEKQLVGYVRLKESVSLNGIADALELPEHIIQINLVELILSDLILCSFDISSGILKKFEIQVKIKNFLIPFHQRVLSMMSNEERMIIGLSCLQRGINLKEIANFMKMKISEVLRIVSLVNGTREFEFRMNERDQLIPIANPNFDTDKTIEEIDRNSLISYRSLLGLIQTKKKIYLSEISDRMEIPYHNVMKGIIDLYLHGFIDGSLISMKFFNLKTTRAISQEYVTFEDWERITIGALISEGKVSMAKLGALLELNKVQTQERALAFISRNIGDPDISNAFLTMKSQPRIPPLIQLNNLDLVDQQIFCYLVTNKEVPLKKLRDIFNLSNIEIYRRVYFLSGSGLLRIKTHKQVFTILEFYENIPIDSIETLDHDLRLLILNLEKIVVHRIKLSKLQKILDWTFDELNLDISYLIGFGYYQGYIKDKKFIRTRGLYKFKEKPKCFECGTLLTNFREPCPECFNPPPECSVCRSKMNSSEKIVICPHCSNPSHDTHIREWLKIKKFCPICRNQINEDALQPLLLTQ